MCASAYVRARARAYVYVCVCWLCKKKKDACVRMRMCLRLSARVCFVCLYTFECMCVYMHVFQTSRCIIIFHCEYLYLVRHVIKINKLMLQ